MLCESCGQADANVYVRHEVNGVSREVNLCEECAGKSGINVDTTMSLTEMLLVGLGELEKQGGDRLETACPFCGMKLADFRKTSRLGCGVCYDAFGPELNPMISGMHKGSRHRGKAPTTFIPEGYTSGRIADLRGDLEDAIADENYEEAARIRDEISVERAREQRDRATTENTHDG